MKKIIAFAGSNSKNSINKQLVIYATTLVEEAEITILDLNDFELPLYGIDYEKEQGIPQTANKFLDFIKTSDGIIISLAEHNGAYTAAFKSLFDWMSRIEGKTFFGKPMLLMATSPGGRGGKSVLDMAQDRFPRHDANIVEVFSLPNFGNNFSNDEIVNSEFNEELLKKVTLFKKVL